jgi:GMP synthase-like glutamine amidotransferase
LASTDVVVWVADGLAADGLDYGDRLSERLAGLGLDVVRRDLTSAAGAVPAARLHVLTGGSTSVNERSGWMPGGLAFTRNLVEAAQRGDTIVAGVCLGSQMIAEAIWPGGVRGAGQIEVGLAEVHWRCRSAERLVVPAFHYEAIDLSTVVGGGGEVVADNEHSPVQGFRLGADVWGLQFHPEFDPADLRRLVLHHRETIEARGGTVESALRSVDELESRWTHEMFDRIFRGILDSAG